MKNHLFSCSILLFTLCRASLQYLTEKNHNQYGKIQATQKNAKHNSILQGSAECLTYA